MSLNRFVRQLNPIQENKSNYVNRVQNLYEAKTGGDTYEVGIIMGWYKAVGKPFDQKTSAVSDKDIKKIKQIHVDVGTKVAKQLIKLEPSIARQTIATHFGKGKPAVSPFWKSHGAGKHAASRTPKTDLIIGKYNISLKMGAGQLMSGAREEALATFYWALSQTSKELGDTDEVKKCIEIINKFRSGYVIGTTANAIKNNTDKDVTKINLVHKDMMSALNALFEKSEVFKYAFTKEAMSGYGKFGLKNTASADYFLVSSATGDKVSFHTITDDAYVKKVANTSTVSVKFKSTSLKTVKDTGENRRWWSALGITSKDLTKVKDEQLNEGIGSFVRGVVQKTKNALKSAIDFAKNLAKRSMSAFLKFLGFEPPEVKYTIKFDV